MPWGCEPDLDAPGRELNLTRIASSLAAALRIVMGEDPPWRAAWPGVAAAGDLRAGAGGLHEGY